MLSLNTFKLYGTFGIVGSLKTESPSNTVHPWSFLVSLACECFISALAVEHYVCLSASCHGQIGIGLWYFELRRSLEANSLHAHKH